MDLIPDLTARDAMRRRWEAPMGSGTKTPEQDATKKGIVSAQI